MAITQMNTGTAMTKAMMMVMTKVIPTASGMAIMIMKVAMTIQKVTGMVITKATMKQ